MRELMESMITSKEKQLKKLQEQFIRDVKDIDTVTYESNSISTLIVMKDLKTEIRTLREQLMYLRCYYPEKEGK